MGVTVKHGVTRGVTKAFIVLDETLENLLHRYIKFNTNTREQPGGRIIMSFGPKATACFWDTSVTTRGFPVLDGRNAVTPGCNNVVRNRGELRTPR